MRLIEIMCVLECAWVSVCVSTLACVCEVVSERKREKERVVSSLHQLFQKKILVRNSFQLRPSNRQKNLRHQR